MSEDLTHFGRFSRVEVWNMAKSDEQAMIDGTTVDYRLDKEVTASVLVDGDRLILMLRRTAQ